ncbi:MAG: Isoquinoline 1-oxidoreductase subunit [Methyloceanibacter sp.]
MALAFAALTVLAGQTDNSEGLKPVSSFAGIKNENERSLALFDEAVKVITHPRCVNCHPAGNRPLQGMDGHPHLPLVVRGADGHGAVGMKCTNCHGPANYDPARVPGHVLWHVAPIEMAWEGKSLGGICEKIKDPKRNGGKTMEELVHHMAEDSLVGWGWNPGAGREPAPGTQEEFGALVAAWAESGAACPAP